MSLMATPFSIPFMGEVFATVNSPPSVALREANAGFPAIPPW
jgi:hypothetical protein